MVLEETRWQGKDIMDMKSHTLFSTVAKKREPDNLGWHLLTKGI